MALQPQYTPRRHAGDRPNILILMSDQHRYDLMTCAGCDRVPTPSLDTIAANGMRFESAFCSSPLCLPARMSMLTGEYPHTLGLGGNYSWLDFRHRTLAHHFAAAGYLTALVGKMHFGDACKHGFEHYLSINDWLSYLGPRVRHYADEIAGNPVTPKFFDSVRDGGSGFPDVDDLWSGPNFWAGNVRPKDMTHMVSELEADDTLDMFVARETVKLMRRYRDHPFLLVAGFMRPHPPMYPPRPWDRLYPVDGVTLPPVGPTDSYPPHLQQMINVYQSRGQARLRADRSGYYGNLAFLDHCVGRVLEGLAELGLRDNTIVIYCSDHGDMDGDHGLFHKGVMFDPSVRIPLLVSHPGRIPAGQVSRAMVSLMDLYPTLAQWVGIGMPADIAGRSFAHALADPRARAREAVFAELSPREEGGRLMVRTGSHKLVHTRGGGDELYDLQDDPGEYRNRIADPALADLTANLRARMKDELES